jgi:hypothetical protein
LEKIFRVVGLLAELVEVPAAQDKHTAGHRPESKRVEASRIVLEIHAPDTEPPRANAAKRI